MKPLQTAAHLLAAILCGGLPSLVVAEDLETDPPPCTLAAALAKLEFATTQPVVITLNLEPAAEEQVAAGRARAERDYAAGRGELEAYGLYLVQHHVDLETGLYVTFKGCCITREHEFEAYNQRLRELVRQRGLPANANGLRGRFAKAESYVKRPPDLEWTPVPAFQGKTGEWIKAGRAELRWNCRDNPFGEGKHAYLEIKGPTGIEESHFNYEVKPLRAAVWQQPELLVIETQDRQRILFWDFPHARELWQYDARWWRAAEDMTKNPGPPPGTQTAPAD